MKHTVYVCAFVCVCVCVCACARVCVKYTSHGGQYATLYLYNESAVVTDF
jgi:hypothetical protein